MAKVLIAEDEPAIGIHLSNVITATKEVEEVYIVCEGDKVYPAIKKLNPEIVILDLKLPGEDGISILKKIEKDSSLKDINIIVYSGEPLYAAKVINFKCVEMFYNKLQPFQTIAVEVKKIAELLNCKKVEREIYNILGQIGFSISHKGTKFLKECIELAIYDNEENLNVMYEKVSRGKKQSSNTVKADVQRAINNMWKYADRENVRRILRLADDEKPSPKNVVPMVKHYVEK